MQEWRVARFLAQTKGQLQRLISCVPCLLDEGGD